MNNMKRALSFLLMLCMLLTALPAQALAVEQDAAAPGAPAGSDEGDIIQNVTVEPLDPSEVTARPQVDREYDERIITPQGNVRVIIEMEADPIFTIGLYGADAETQTAYIRNQQEKVIERIEDEVLDGEKLDVRYNYTTLLNGVATQVPADSLEAIRQVEGVARVTVQRVYEPLAGEVSNNIASTLAEALDQEGGITPDSDDIMVGAEGAWKAGYKGEGLRIAVIDTGIDLDHPSFAAMDTSDWEEGYEADLLTLEEIEEVLADLNATKSFNNEKSNKQPLAAENVYYNNKIPFAFNYIDVNYNRVGHDYDSQGDHGTHVSGIAAANYLPEKTKVVGVAPNAQILTFKIFGEAGGAYTEDIVAALEDAIRLGADVVNMSLGTNGGLRSSGDDVIDKIYASLEGAGVILAVAAGNSYTAGLYNTWGDNKSLTTDIDNGILSAPASYPNATSVASLTNTEINAYYIEIGGERFTYTNGSTADGTPSPNADLNTIGNKRYDVAVVGNMGQKAEDFTKADVKGKIAIVSRGVTAFTEKGKLAEDAGAVALIVYNNEEGSMGMDMSAFTGSIPVVIVTKKIGERILEILKEKPGEQMFVSSSTDFVNTYEGGEASDFSSWGPLSSLHLEPDIAAPGGGIYSTRNGGIYGQMSGTSMATPNLAGVAALVKQYLEKTRDLSNEQIFALVNQLLMSTSEPQVYSTNGLYYSPRQQGSGLAKADRAVETKGYITVTDSTGNPKAESEAELFDDPDGRFQFTFTVHNTDKVDHYYNVYTQVQTEGVSENEKYPGLYFMSGLPELLDADVTVTSKGIGGLTYDFDGNGLSDSNDAQWLYDRLNSGDLEAEAFRYELDGVEGINKADVQRYLDILTEKYAGAEGRLLCVPANGTVNVTVEIQVTPEGKNWLKTYFPKGGYVEGFMMLDSMDGGVDLSMPYMGFCGDWTAANMFEEAMYWDDENDPDAPDFSAGVNTLYSMVDGEYTYPGLNPYVSEEVEPYDIHNIAISPNDDGNLDLIEDIYLYLMRNAEWVSVYYKDEDGIVLNNNLTTQKGNVAYSVPKSNYSASYGIITPFVSSWYFDTYQFIDPNTQKPLEDGTRVTLEVSAKLPYGSNTENVYTWKIPITVDTKAPEVLTEGTYAPTIRVDSKTGKQYLTVTFTDTVNIAAAFITNSSGTVVRQNHVWTIDKTKFKPGEPYTVTYDITGCGNTFCLGLGDYGYNESFYKLTTTDNDPVVNDKVLYGYRVGDSKYHLTTGGYDDHVYGWVAIDPKTGDYEVQSDDYWVDYAINAAEYYGGYVVAVLYSGEVVAIRPGYWDERMPVSEITVTNPNGYKVAGYRELAFNPKEPGCLYIMLEMKDTKGAAGTYLGKLDVATGNVTLFTTRVREGFSFKTVPASTGSNIRVMAFDDDGTLYGVTADAIGNNELVTISTTTGQIEEHICELQDVIKPVMGDYASSMTWYENALYLTFMAQDDAKLVKIVPAYNEEEDEHTAAVTVVDDMDLDPCFEGLIAIDCREFELDLKAEPNSIKMDPSQMRLLPGNNANVKVIPDPWYANVENLVWSSSDPAAVMVNETSGDIRSVAEGSATVTATMKLADGTDISASCQITVVNPKSKLQAFVEADGAGQYSGQWISFTADNPRKVKDETNYSFFDLSAAERVGDYIFAYNTYTRSLYRFDPSKGVDAETGNYYYDVIDVGNLKYGIMVDMGYNPHDGKLYGLRLTLEQDAVDLVEIDMLTGRQYNEKLDIRLNGSSASAITFGEDGTCYLLAANGTFGTYDVETRATVDPVVLGVTGHPPYMNSNSMTMDRETGDIYFYTWNMGTSEFYWIDKTSGRTQQLGSILGDAAIIGFFWNYGKDEYTAPEVEPSSTYVDYSKDMYVVAGSSAVIRTQFSESSDGTPDATTWTIEPDKQGIKIEHGVVYAEETASGTYKITGIANSKDVEAPIEITVHIIQKPKNGLGLYVTQTPDNHGHIWAKFDIGNLDAGRVRLNETDTFIGAAENVNGTVYAYGYGLTGYKAVEFRVFDGTDYSLKKTIQVGGKVFPIDMTLDYTTGVMYAIGRGVTDTFGAKALYVVNTDDGTLYKLADIKEEDEYEEETKDVYLVTLACDNEGQLYGISVDSILYKVDKKTGKATEVGELDDPHGAKYHIKSDEQGRNVIYMQSMTFDPDTNNLYWSYVGNREARVSGDLLAAYETKLIYIDVEKASDSEYRCTELGTLSLTGAEAVGLHVFPEKEIENSGLCDVAVDKSKVVVLEGKTETIETLILPLEIKDVNVTWKSDDDEIATVENGVITTKKPGVTTITVTVTDNKQRSVVEKKITVTVAGKNDQLVITEPGKWLGTSIYATDEQGKETPMETTIVSVARDGDTWYGIDENNNLWRFADATLTKGEIIAENIIGNIPHTITIVHGLQREQQKLFEEDYPVTYIDFDVEDGTVYFLASGRLKEKFNYGYSESQSTVVDILTMPTYIFTFKITDIGDDKKVPEAKITMKERVSRLSTCDEITVVDGTVYILDSGENKVEYLSKDGIQTLVAWDKNQFDQRVNETDPETGKVISRFGIGMAYSEELKMLYVVGVDKSNFNGVVVFEIDPANGEWRVITEGLEHVFIPENFLDIAIVRTPAAGNAQ